MVQKAKNSSMLWVYLASITKEKENKTKLEFSTKMPKRSTKTQSRPMEKRQKFLTILP